MKVLSCVPKQLSDFDEKLAWLDAMCKKHRPDIFVTTQEYFGGAVMMSHDRDFELDFLYPKLKKLNKKYGTAFVCGVQQQNKDRSNSSAIWFINEDGEYLGRVRKFALPKYDHIVTNGFGQVTPETDLFNRFKLFEICGAHVSAIFCWEVYSDILWTGLGIMKPDLIFSMIKFGANAWPKVRKNKATGLNEVVDFGYGGWKEEGRWIERLNVANLWQVKCPIVCSTNSWNLRPISMPMAGTISNIPGQAEHTLWHPTKEDKMKTIPQKVIIDEFNLDAIRTITMNKFIYKDKVGEFPPFDIGKLTMHLKINRIENRLISGREETVTKKKQKQIGIGDRKNRGLF